MKCYCGRLEECTLFKAYAIFKFYSILFRYNYILCKASELSGTDEAIVFAQRIVPLLTGKAAGGYTIYVPDIAVVSKEAKEGITAELPDLHEVAAWIRKENKK